MVKTISNKFATLRFNSDVGTLTSMTFNDDSTDMNWVITKEDFIKIGFNSGTEKMLGKSLVEIDGTVVFSENVALSACIEFENGIAFKYKVNDFELVHTFTLLHDSLKWEMSLQNCGNTTASINKMLHWLPIKYIMHESIQENLNDSCSFVASINGSASYAFCRRRNGTSKNLAIISNSGMLKSIGSLCKYKNLFFEKSAPSLSGFVLHNLVQCYGISNSRNIDWQYSQMYEPITLQAGDGFNDTYIFDVYDSNCEEDVLRKYAVPVVHFEPVVLVNDAFCVTVESSKEIVRCDLFYVENGIIQNEKGSYTLKKDGATTLIFFEGCKSAGERKLVFHFEGKSTSQVLFTVYTSFKEIINAICTDIFQNRFEPNPDSAFQYGYKPFSIQGEGCAKGSLLLLKNLLSDKNPEEISQAESSAVYYLRKRWFNDDFTAKKIYPNGFARIIDIDYIIVHFYLLSKFDNKYLQLNSQNTYLEWAYSLASYRLQRTPDKLEREVVETELASMISWLQVEMIDTLYSRGFLAESEHLKKLWNSHIEIQLKKMKDYSFVETEHYFDNAGISVYAETLLNSDYLHEGLVAADLLLANVTPSNDYRSFAPDRWWEALAPMYHNLWAVFSAKAMLTAYDKSKQVKYLFAGYKAMIPMFYNYDWNAVSARKILQKGQGASSYCLTSPNLNEATASRNRFGQSIFTDDFFQQLDVQDDDWDLGMDVVVYLYTFGQTAYLVRDDNNKVLAVNGKYEKNGDSYTIYSNAAFPKAYKLDAFNIEITTNDFDGTIEAVELDANNNIKVVLNGTKCFCPVIVTKDNCDISESVTIIYETK